MSTTPTRWAQDVGLVAADRGVLTTNARLILMLLCERVDENWSVDMAVSGQLDRISGLHRNVVSRALTQLTDLHVLSRHQERTRYGRVGCTQFFMRPYVLAELLKPYGEDVPAHILDNVVSTAKDVHYLMDSVAVCVRKVFIQRSQQARGSYWEAPTPYELGTSRVVDTTVEEVLSAAAPCTSEDVIARNTPESVHGDRHTPCTENRGNDAPCTAEVHGEIREIPGNTTRSTRDARTRTRMYTRAHTDHDQDPDQGQRRETKPGTSPAGKAVKNSVAAATEFIAGLDATTTINDLIHRGVQLGLLAAGYPEFGHQPIQVWQAIVDVIYERAERSQKTIKRPQGYVSQSLAKDPIGVLSEAHRRVFPNARAAQLHTDLPAGAGAGYSPTVQSSKPFVHCTQHGWEGRGQAKCPTCRSEWLGHQTGPEPLPTPGRLPNIHAAVETTLPGGDLVAEPAF